MTKPLPTFISYVSTDEDQALLQKFEQHLNLLQQRGLVTLWHRRQVPPGTNIQQALEEHLEAASVIIFLVSAGFLTSNNSQKEMQRALVRLNAGEAIVIPVLLHPVVLHGSPLEHMLYLPRNKRPVALWKNKDEAFATIVAEIGSLIEQYSSPQNKKLSEKEKRLRALLFDQSGFVQDRLTNFVGRQQELVAIQEMIAQRLSTGGYVAITGLAGQGKSSVIAKLVEIYGIEQAIHHFIPLNPGLDHQVGLLHNLMARLILKHDLSDFYIASDNRAALSGYFSRVLAEVVKREGQEVIFVDGLDQLEEDFNGTRDLSFLPTNPPPGIVFVLGTRPNDIMSPLELLKPLDQYPLPNLSRYDFNFVLAHRQISLEKKSG